MSSTAYKPLTRYQMNLAITAVEQVRDFLQDSGLDPESAKTEQLTGALQTLEMMRRHWTPERTTGPAPRNEDTP